MFFIRHFLSFIVLCLLVSAHLQAQDAAAYIIVDDQTGKILEVSNADKKLQIASLTKIATAMVALDWAELESQDLSQLATVPPEALRAGGINPIGLQAGEQLSVRDLIYACLLQSDNIAAHTLAHHVGRSLYRLSPPKVQSLDPTGVFVAQMNALATKLGMTRTLFLNPSGLDNVEKRDPYSTAADMARLTRYAMSKSGFRFYVSQKERAIHIHSAAGKRGFVCRNTNELLGQNAIDGVKTGRTRLAGDCLILSSARSSEIRKEGQTTYVTPRRVTVVLLGARERFPLGNSLLQHGWKLYDHWAAQGRPLTAKEKL